MTLRSAQELGLLGAVHERVSTLQPDRALSDEERAAYHLAVLDAMKVIARMMKVPADEAG